MRILWTNFDLNKITMNLRSPKGWASAGVFDEDEEQCQVTNLDGDAAVVADLARFVREGGAAGDDEDDGFGPKGAAAKPAKAKKVEGKVSEISGRTIMSYEDNIGYQKCISRRS